MYERREAVVEVCPFDLLTVWNLLHAHSPKYLPLFGGGEMYRLTCPFCGESREFSNVRDALKWAVQHTLQNHITTVCPICGLNLGSVEKLKKHLAIAHACSCDKRKCWLVVALTSHSLYLNQIACSCIPCMFDDPPSWFDEKELCRIVSEL